MHTYGKTLYLFENHKCSREMFDGAIEIAELDLHRCHISQRRCGVNVVLAEQSDFNSITLTKFRKSVGESTERRQHRADVQQSLCDIQVLIATVRRTIDLQRSIMHQRCDIDLFLIVGDEAERHATFCNFDMVATVQTLLDSHCSIDVLRLRRSASAKQS